MPEAHRTHPAIVRISQIGEEAVSDPQKLWADRWHPVRAEEVLGNEQCATFLRNWLGALQLELAPQTENPKDVEGKAAALAKRKRPRVMRQVSKRCRKKQRIDSDDDDSWIAEDGHVSYHEEEDEDEDDLLLGKSREEEEYAPRLSRQNSQNEVATFTDLANTIVLSGPSGCGKTAAIYACAEELGWEVFEVYPGIGKRNSANLDNLVGEVGKNHLVSTVHGKEDDGLSKSRFAALLEGKTQSGVGKASDEASTSRTASVNQSLILLEEVDILYAEDANFWPAVKSLIKDCRRPVICTCNGMWLAPSSR